MRRRSYFILVAVAAWVIFIGLVSALPVLNGISTWERSLRFTLGQWLPWTLLLPVIFWLAWRFPIGRSAWRWRISLHLVVGVLSVALASWISFHLLAPRLQPFELRGSGPDDRPPLLEGLNGNRFPPPGEQRPSSAEWNRLRAGPPAVMRVWFNAPIYLTLLSIGHAVVYFRRSQQRDRAALALQSQLDQARLQTLRMQLQPHFLFNTLNAISTLVQVDPLAAQEMIGSLGQMLRLSLDSKSDPEVPVEQELKFLDSYLEIARLRFGDRLQVKTEISSDTRGALVPTFILQPLVENAVRHGIEPSDQAGTIELSIRRVGARLSIIIRDTGPGLAAEHLAASAAQTGIGIPNTRARLESLYPGQHRFSVDNALAGGCVANLEIPFHTEPLPVSVEFMKS